GEAVAGPADPPEPVRREVAERDRYAGVREAGQELGAQCGGPRRVDLRGVREPGIGELQLVHGDVAEQMGRAPADLDAHVSGRVPVRGNEPQTRRDLGLALDEIELQGSHLAPEVLAVAARLAEVLEVDAVRDDARPAEERVPADMVDVQM